MKTLLAPNTYLSYVVLALAAVAVLLAVTPLWGSPEPALAWIRKPRG